jgi:hypothetical protein
MTKADSLMAVSLRISQWAARRLDRKEAAALAAQHNVPTDILSVPKRLLPMAAPLEKVHKLSGEIRTLYYSRTVPWMYDGVNVMKADTYLDFVQTVRPMLADWKTSAADFVHQYPALKAQAKLIMNGLYKEEDYPSPDEMERKFNIDLLFFPLPNPEDFRIKASDAEQAALRQQLEDNIKASYQASMRSVWERLYDVVSKAHERLSDPRNKFHDTLVSNAQELCALLPSLNIADDPHLETLRQELEGSLCRHTPDSLRQPGHTRSQTAAKMADIMAKMGAFYTP